MQTAGDPSIKRVADVMRALADNFETVGLSVVEYRERGASIETPKELLRRNKMKIGALRHLD